MKHAYILLVLTLSIVSSNSYAFGSKRPSTGSGTGSTTNPKPPTPPTTPIPPISTNPPNSSAFASPWRSTITSIVIDAYEGNSIDWDAMATDKKVAAIIHRASNGTKADTQYVARKKIAKERGYLWGAYHLAKKGNPIEQAKFFLSMINNEADTLMILDLEDTSSGSFMTVDEAILFMNYVYEQTGRIPVIYANHTVTLQLNSKVKNNPLFQQSKLWYARFKATIADYPIGIWPNYFLWQFSSEINCTSTGSCLYNVPGTKFDMDVNVYNGSATDLAAEWNN